MDLLLESCKNSFPLTPHYSIAQHPLLHPAAAADGEGEKTKTNHAAHTSGRNTYNRAPLRHPLLCNVLHSDLNNTKRRKNENTAWKSYYYYDRCLRRSTPGFDVYHMGYKNTTPRSLLSGSYRRAIGDPAAGVHRPESPAAEHGTHLVNLLEGLLFHFDWK